MTIAQQQQISGSIPMPHLLSESNKLDRSAPPPQPTTRQKIIGAVLIIFMNCLWVASAELQQYIYGSGGVAYPKPIMVSFCSMSLYFVYLIGFFKKSWREVWNLKDEDNAGLSSPPLPTPSGALRYPMSYIFPVALIVAPIHLLSSLTYNTGILYTTVASSSIICSLTSLFTLAIGAISGIETFSFFKLFASLLAISGVAMIMGVDARDAKEGSNPLLGDLLGLASAPLFATFTVLLKAYARPQDAVIMPLQFGFFGAITLFYVAPGLLIFDRLQIEKFEWPSLRVFAFLCVNAMIGSVFPSVLYGISVVLTTPVTGALAMSLMVPLSMLWDSLKGVKKFSVAYVVGAVLVIVGFLLVNIPMGKDPERISTKYEAVDAEEDGSDQT